MVLNRNLCAPRRNPAIVVQRAQRKTASALLCELWWICSELTSFSEHAIQMRQAAASLFFRAAFDGQDAIET